MKRTSLMIKLIFLISVLLIPTLTVASAPLWTLTALSPTTIQLSTNASALVQYRIQNQSSKPHTLVMVPIAGVTQLVTSGNCPNPFVLESKQSCTLSLIINGSQITNQVKGGPIICQQAPNGSPNPLLCYQSSLADSLNISVTPTPLSYFYAGTQNGNVYYSTNNGLTWTPTAALPSAGSTVNSVFARANTLYAGTDNGYIYYSTNNGYTWNNTTPPDGSAVKSIFVTSNAIYVGTTNGNVLYSTDNGNNWRITNQPDGSIVNSVYVTSNGLYAGTTNGSVYYSVNNGLTWTAINGQPDGSAIINVYVANNTVFVNTANQYVYSSTSITGGGTWTRLAQTVYALFVNATGNAIYAGTQSGYVFSITNGTELGFVTYSPINSIFVAS